MRACVCVRREKLFNHITVTSHEGRLVKSRPESYLARRGGGGDKINAETRFSPTVTCLMKAPVSGSTP